MEIQSYAGPSCAILPTSTQAPRADVRLSEDRPAKGSSACHAPDPRFRGGDYTVEVRQDTQVPDSTAEQTSIGIGLLANGSSRWGPRRRSRPRFPDKV